MGICAAFVDLPPIKTLFQTGQVSVSGVGKEAGGGSEIVQKKNNEKECWIIPL